MESKLVVIGYEPELLYRKEHVRAHIELIDTAPEPGIQRILRLVKVTPYGKIPNGFKRSHEEFYLEYTEVIENKIKYRCLTQIPKDAYGKTATIVKDPTGFTYVKYDGIYFNCYRNEHVHFIDMVTTVVSYIDKIQHCEVCTDYYRKYTYEMGIK